MAWASLVASACMSTSTRSARSFCRMASTQRKGQSQGGMCTRPMRLMTSTSAPEGVCSFTQPLPAVSAGWFAGRSRRGSWRK